MKKILIHVLIIWRDWCYVLRGLKSIRETAKTQTPIKFHHLVRQKLLGVNRKVYWPIHRTSIIRNPRNIYCGIETCPGYEKGCYIQAVNQIHIGDYTQIANNVGIITSNHDVTDLRKHIDSKPIVIGKYCWIGMNSVVLPEVKLGDFTIVGAGSIVTKSFEEGYCIIAGNPAKVIKKINKEDCILYRNPIEYHGFIRKNIFEKNKKKYTNV